LIDAKPFLRFSKLMELHLRKVRVSPKLSAALEPLHSLAYNLYWDWNADLAALFHRLDPQLWEETSRNPVALLGLVEQERLEAAARDIDFLAHLQRAQSTFHSYMTEPRWFQEAHADDGDFTVAYFSAEFGLASCLPIYSGGLGVLAGDHLKSASDLGVPLVGVGLLYQEGYFRQYLNADGWQLENYPPNDFYNMPLTLERGSDGEPLKIFVEFPGRKVFARIWRVDVGRVPLFLLDTKVSENSEEDRRITRALYSGGVELRIQQLMMLGIGGYRALVALNREPTVCHMNEGHAGFLGVERTRRLMEQRGISYPMARDIVEDGNLFTTHTPVPAGFDVFSRDLIERYMSAYVEKVGIGVDKFMDLGRRHRDDYAEPFNMAVLAIRHAAERNGVSKLHGKVSRQLVQQGGAWTEWPEDEVPIDSVTNGVHTLTYVAPEMAKLFDRYLDPEWRLRPSEARVWEGVDQIPAEELWRVHVELRRKLVVYVRNRYRWQLKRRGAGDMELATADRILKPDALTIGFARRFATYKRATLLFSDPERLASIVSSRDRPVQFIFSGKAHPKDLPAKEFIKVVASKIKDPALSGSIVFLEDYDIDVAKHLVRGCDLWLNNPQRPHEASGTSGMKLGPNGGLNLSILDGWWAEGYRPELGWSIGNGEDYHEGSDENEAHALYGLLENHVVPTFYDRGTHDCPEQWVRMMRCSIRNLVAQFSSDRMVREYADRFYRLISNRYRGRLVSATDRTEEIVEWKRKVRGAWKDVEIIEIAEPSGQEVKIGDPFRIHARVRLGALSPDDVAVQVYHGLLDAKEQLRDIETVPMKHVEQSKDVHTYACDCPFARSGRHGYTIRVIPRHATVLIPNELTCIRWAP
jgi:glycogen phosphorylase